MVKIFWKGHQLLDFRCMFAFHFNIFFLGGSVQHPSHVICSHYYMVAPQGAARDGDARYKLLPARIFVKSALFRVVQVYDRLLSLRSFLCVTKSRGLYPVLMQLLCSCQNPTRNDRAAFKRTAATLQLRPRSGDIYFLSAGSDRSPPFLYK